MDDKRFVRFLWVAKASLLAVLLHPGFEVVVSLLHLGVVLDPGIASGEPHAAETPAAPPQDDAPADYNVIAQRNLFGATEKAGDSPPSAAVPQTSESGAATEELGLSLIGTLAGGPTASRAILQDSRTNKADAYRIGDSVASATAQTPQSPSRSGRRKGLSFEL